MRRTEVLHMVIEPELKARLDEAAHNERRSRAALVRNVLQDWLDQHNY